MAVYVDRERNSFGRMIMCHMVADTIGELLDMADRIGLHRRHFQPGSHPHFDISLGYRAKAVRAGAVEVDRKCLVEVMKRQSLRLREDPAELAAFHQAERQSTKGALNNRFIKDMGTTDGNGSTGGKNSMSNKGSMGNKGNMGNKGSKGSTGSTGHSKNGKDRKENRDRKDVRLQTSFDF